MTDTANWSMMYPSLQNMMGVHTWPQNPSQHRIQAFAVNHWESESEMKHTHYPVLIQSSNFTYVKTDAQKEKVIFPRSYSKTLGELEPRCTHRATSLHITKEETQLTWNIIRTWKKFKISSWPWKVNLYIQWNVTRRLSPSHQREDMRTQRSEEATCHELSQR